jgi:hypothetical protein
VSSGVGPPSLDVTLKQGSGTLEDPRKFFTDEWSFSYPFGCWTDIYQPAFRGDRKIIIALYALMG